MLMRRDQRQTQEELAIATGVSRETIVRIEHGHTNVFFRNVVPIWAQLGVSPSTGILLTQPETFALADAIQTQQITTAIRHYITLVTAHRDPPPSVRERAVQLRTRVASTAILTEVTLLQAIIAWNLPLGDVAEILLATDDPQRVAIRHATLRREWERQRAADAPADRLSYPVLVNAIRDLRVIADQAHARAAPDYVTIYQIAEDLDRLRMALTLPFTIHANR